MKRKGITEVCHYCGFSYHPMLRATLKREEHDGEKPGLIYVCEIGYDENGSIEVHDRCKKKALEDGYELRRDLTPRR